MFDTMSGEEKMWAEFDITVTGVEDVDFGVSLQKKPNEEPVNLMVKTVHPGPVMQWNENNPTQVVKTGDKIVSVNNVSGHLPDMIREMCHETVVLTIRRPLK